MKGFNNNGEHSPFNIQHSTSSMTTNYDSSAIEVLTGLEPVRKRPAMYTTTERPNHLAQEVIDNSADEAIAGYCDEIVVTLHEDNSVTVSDNGRGMPVVNALSKRLQVWVRRDGNEYAMTFAGGKKKSELKVIGQVGKRNTGTTVRFWVDEKFFDTAKFNLPRLKHVMRAKAVLSPGLRMRFIDENDKANNEEWFYEDGLKAYLMSELAGVTTVPAEPFMGHFKGADHEVDRAVVWLAEDDEINGER